MDDGRWSCYRPSSIVHRRERSGPMRTTALPVDVRAAEDADLQPCLTLDDSYVATHTWQVEAVRGDPGTMTFQLNSSLSLGESPFTVTFRPVRLPRARKVVGPIAAS